MPGAAKTKTKQKSRKTGPGTDPPRGGGGSGKARTFNLKRRTVATQGRVRQAQARKDRE